MSQSANDWASPDPGMNMTLTDADTFSNALAGALTLQIGSRWVLTRQNQTVSEADLRANPYLSPLPVNLFGMLAVPGCQGFNLAEFRTTLRNVASSDDPTGSLVMVLQQMLPPSTDVPNMFTRMPAVQAVIAAAVKSI